MKPQRAPLSKDLQSLRSELSQLLPILEAQPGWYGSVYYERKASRTASVNLKQTQISDHVNAGVVLRIYDGFTLYEQATDDLEPASLKSFALQFAKRVQPAQKTSGVKGRPYLPPTWKVRQSVPLDEEIRSQIPTNASAKVPVHFGIRFEKDPMALSNADCRDQLERILDRCKQLAPRESLRADDLTFILARQGFSLEESLFIDRETDMSQTLYRMSLTVVTMAGANRTHIRIGGLGGLESVELKDEQIQELLRDLKALKNAKRLEPGKYRVLVGPVVAGVVAHEAFGHSQEADTCARGRSKAWELHKSGEIVGNKHATILNNPAVFQNGAEKCAAWGSYFFDEEGWLAQEQVLLDQGKLKAPMTNLTSAIRLGIPRTANGKRESWANGVYTRQTNTYFSPGDATFDELMVQLGDGFLATHPAGGMEDPKGMGIQVGIAYLQEVKGGKLTGNVFKGPAGGDIQMTGYTPDVLNAIIRKSKIDSDSKAPDSSKHPYNDAGGCGKYHKEFVYAGCGGPYLLLDQVILG